MSDTPAHPADAQRLSDCATIVHRLQQRSVGRTQYDVYSFLPDGEEISESLTCSALFHRAQVIAARLRQVASPGDRVLLLYPPGLDFISALFGCFVSGMIAVPACPPEVDGAAEGLSRLGRIAASCSPSVVLAAGRNADQLLRNCRGQNSMSTITAIVTDAISDERIVAPVNFDVRPETPAFLQYTSGSTGDPRGVIVTHGNIVANITAMQRAFLSGSAGVSWLPAYHDMGLVGAILPAVWTGIPLYLLPPLLMLKHPQRWLQTVSRYRAAISPSPNFAFDYCVRRITESQKKALDLSCWKVACVGAEPIRIETLRRFSDAFSGCGFRPNTFYPCYGLAEATLFVTGGKVGSPTVVRRIGASKGISDAESTTRAGVVGVELVGCGQPATGHEVLIVDPATRCACTPGTIGEIWIRGPSVAQGYWMCAEESQATFGAMMADDHGPCLRTGDLGVIEDGELYITGRLKEVIVIRGQNYFPADIEDIVGRAHPAFQGRAGAAFGCSIEGEEQLVIVQEVDRRSESDDSSVLLDAIRVSVSEQLQLRVHDVRLVRAGTLPKTTSGKIRRGECRARYLNNSLTSSD